MVRNLRRVGRLLWPAGLLLAGVIGAAAQDQGSPEARQACTPDAIHLCSDFIPDVPKITKCMIAKYKELSPDCQHEMARQHRAFRHHKRYKTCDQGGPCH